MKKERKQTRKTVSKPQSCQQKKIQQNKSRANGTLNDVSLQIIYDSIDFENLTGKFWIKTSGNYNLKS